LRISADSDGTSRFDKLELPLESSEYGLATAIVPAVGFGFRAAIDAASFASHPAPRRQLVAVLTGAMEIGAGDGEVHRFLPGDLLLIEDTAGDGHSLWQESGTQLLAVALPPDLDFAEWSVSK
jgi:hypothetical protein